jgi:uncharacterized protein (TIGR00725 family)
MFISVIGGEKCDNEIYSISYEVGSHIAKFGAVLITGGGGGVMQAACKGAKDFGGTTIGFLPSCNRSEGNSFLDYAVVTGLGYARNVLVALNGDIIIAINGGYGTLSEISLAKKFEKKIYGIKSWDVGIKNFNDAAELFSYISKEINL